MLCCQLSSPLCEHSEAIYQETVDIQSYLVVFKKETVDIQSYLVVFKKELGLKGATKHWLQQYYIMNSTSENMNSSVHDVIESDDPIWDVVKWSTMFQFHTFHDRHNINFYI